MTFLDPQAMTKVRFNSLRGGSLIFLKKIPDETVYDVTHNPLEDQTLMEEKLGTPKPSGRRSQRGRESILSFSPIPRVAGNTTGKWAKKRRDNKTLEKIGTQLQSHKSNNKKKNCIAIKQKR